VAFQEPIGLVAGSGELPFHFARVATKKGHSLCLFAIRGAADPRLSSFADQICWASTGQVGSLIAFFKRNNIRRLAFHGKVQHGSFFQNIRLDWKGLALWSSAKDKSGPGLLTALGAGLTKEGFQILDGRFLMNGLLAPKGYLTRTRPSKGLLPLFKKGILQAKALARLGIGQSIVVKDGAVAAVEAMEGTDEALKRAGKLAGKGVILIKTASPRQDWRFDIPTLGVGTVQNLVRINASGIVLEAGKSFLLEKEKMIRQADSKKIFILAV